MSFRFCKRKVEERREVEVVMLVLAINRKKALVGRLKIILFCLLGKTN